MVDCLNSHCRKRLTRFVESSSSALSLSPPLYVGAYVNVCGKCYPFVSVLILIMENIFKLLKNIS